MKKNFLIILSFLAVSFSANAQNPLPVDDETKLITYKKVTEVAATSKTELYNRAFAWANVYYKNPANVIREKNAEEGKLVLKARYKIYNEPDKKTKVATDAGDVQYTLTLECKEGKYRYVLNNIGWQQISAFPAEKWMDTKNQYYTKAWDYYLKQTDENVKKILADLEKAMLTAPKVKKDEW
jgi:Domain of unknown function (DUF4468) with TBP-like fold